MGALKEAPNSNERARASSHPRRGGQPSGPLVRPQANPGRFSSAPRYNLRILRSLADWIVDNRGADALVQVARSAGLEASDVDGSSRWTGLEQIDAFLAHARTFVPDDEAFKRACVHRLAESLGPLRLLLWATSPGALYRQSKRNYHLIADDCEPEVMSSTRTSMHVRFPIKRGRLFCLLSQAQTAELPALWGLPRAHLVEEACGGLGDDSCVWRLRWFDARQWLPGALGLACGVAAAIGLHVAGLGAPAAWLAVPALGSALGTLYESRRTGHANQEVGRESEDALRVLLEEEADARRELLALTQRQRDWSRMLEEDINERSSEFQSVVARLQDGQQARETSLRGVSHDLRNPLTVLVGGVSLLRQSRTLGVEERAVLDDFELATDRMRALTDELMRVATSKKTLMRLSPQRLEVASLSERLRRRIRALVHGKDIRASVFRTREAPDSFQIDPLLFDRVVDNILTNAAKYTERGSIVVEVDGTPKTLVIKVSDTGRGIGPAELGRIFQPGGSEEGSRASGSWGVGLSVVVQLLGQIGGRLEVMSKPNQGTTLWLYFPISENHVVPAASESQLEDYPNLLNRVVTIRKVFSA